jgi:hypothetical protein
VGNVYVALIHHPVLNRVGEAVTSSVTSIDLHDIARAGRTYGVEGTFVVHPSAPQRRFARRVMDHFLSGPGRDFHPTRAEALRTVEVVADLDGAVEEIEKKEEIRPILVATSAREIRKAIGYGTLREQIQAEPAPCLVLFGTSWGITDEALSRLDVRLEPVRASVDTGFNHLSVRSAVGIVLDRLLGG